MSLRLSFCHHVSVKSKNTSVYFTTVEVYLIDRFKNVRKQYKFTGKQQEEKAATPSAETRKCLFYLLDKITLDHSSWMHQDVWHVSTLRVITRECEVALTVMTEQRLPSDEKKPEDTEVLIFLTRLLRGWLQVIFQGKKLFSLIAALFQLISNLQMCD